MRILVYNIRYGTGTKKPVLPVGGYHRNTRKTLSEIIEFIRPIDPDIIGLLEVDNGSFRHKNLNQAEAIANELGHFHTYQSKYKEKGFISRVPVMKEQGNAFLARDSMHNIKFHYFSKGMKRLVIELELEHLVVFLVHLAVGHSVRHRQLSDLYQLVKETKKPHIVAGDFNTRWGDKEIDLFLGATGLIQPDQKSTPTFPSWAPKRQLDFILHSEGIAVDNFWIPQTTLSDHLPLAMDFHVNGTGS